MNIQDLRANPENPRIISDARLEQLRKALDSFGDLSGIVFNRKTKRLCGGHQRVKLFNPKTPVTVERKFAKPSRTGTVAEGFVILNGERFAYREVHWDAAKEKAANIAANRGAGDWDLDQLGEWFQDLKDADFDLNLTLFDEDERQSFFEPKPKKTKAKEPNPDLERDVIACPKCGYKRGLTVPR